MPSSGAIKAGRAYVEMFADNSLLDRGLKQAENRMKAFGTSAKTLGKEIMGAGAAILAPLAAASKVFVDMGAELVGMAARTGISASALSELEFAAKGSGVELGTLENGLRKMQKAIFGATTGNKENVASLALLKLTAEDLNHLKPEKQFELIADRISQIHDPTARAAIAMQIFGKTGTSLLPMLAGGAKRIEAFRAEAQRLGLTIKDVDANAAQQLGVQFSTLWEVIKRGAFAIGTALLPVLSQWTQAVIRAMSVAVRWIDSHRTLFQWALKIGVGLVAAGAAVYAWGVAFAAAAKIIGIARLALAGLVGAINILAAVARRVLAFLLLDVVKTAVSAFTSLWSGVVRVTGVIAGGLASALAYLATPMGLLVVTGAALIAVMVFFAATSTTAASRAAKAFRDFTTDAIGAWQGMVDAIAAGDIGMAGKIGMKFLELEWLRTTQFLSQTWAEFSKFFFDTWVEAVHNVSEFFIKSNAEIATHFTKQTFLMVDAWTAGVSLMKKAYIDYWRVCSKLGIELSNIKPEAKEFVKGVIDAGADSAKNNVSKEAGEELDKSGKRRKEALDKIEADRTNTLKLDHDQREKEHNTRAAADQAAVAKAQAAVDAARGDLEKANAAAALKRAQAAAAEKNDPKQIPFNPGDPDFDLGAVKAKNDIAGTFNAAGVSGLGGGSETPAKHLSAIKAEALRHNQLLKDSLKVFQSIDRKVDKMFEWA